MASFVVPGKLIVRFDPGTSPGRVLEMKHMIHHSGVGVDDKSVPGSLLLTVAKSGPPQWVWSLTARDGVASVEQYKEELPSFTR